jgi:membrane protein YqaA with SNARE-associated domain
MPVFAPPTWTILVIFLAKYELNLALVVACAVLGATLGRFILAHYTNWFSHQIFNKRQFENLGYLGKKFGKTHKTNMLFTFIYSLTPLSTTALFIAAGIAQIRIKFVLIGFFFGRLISYTILAISTRSVAANINDLMDGIITWKSLATSLAGFSIIFLFLFVDWIELYEYKHFRLNFRIWKWNRDE